MNQTDDLAALQAAATTLDTISTEVDALEAQAQALKDALAAQANTPEVDAAFQALTDKITAIQGKLTPPA